MKTFGWVVLVLMAGVSGLRALDGQEAAQLVEEGNQLFRRANQESAGDPVAAHELYEKAVMRYERVVKDGGVENGRLYYNIGNVYFRMKDTGRAILNYRRAEQYIPNDPNLHHNMQYARATRVDSIEEKQKTRLLKTLFFWHYDLNGATRAVIFAVLFAALWGLALVRLFCARTTLNWLIGSMAIASVLMLGSLLSDTIRSRTVKPGVVVAGEVVARKGDSVTYEPSFRAPLHAGVEFVIIEDRGDWKQVELLDGRRCWLPSGSVEMVRK